MSDIQNTTSDSGAGQRLTGDELQRWLDDQMGDADRPFPWACPDCDNDIWCDHPDAPTFGEWVVAQWGRVG